VVGQVLVLCRRKNSYLEQRDVIEIVTATVPEPNIFS
jgi:hypothetical protein